MFWLFLFIHILMYWCYHYFRYYCTYIFSFYFFSPLRHHQNLCVVFINFVSSPWPAATKRCLFLSACLFTIIWWGAFRENCIQFVFVSLIRTNIYIRIIFLPAMLCDCVCVRTHFRWKFMFPPIVLFKGVTPMANFKQVE